MDTDLPRPVKPDRKWSGLSRHGGHVTDVGSGPVEPFEAQRRYLGSIACRLLGSVTDAEDMLQEAWLRW
jgi:hypothetical protein